MQLDKGGYYEIIIYEGPLRGPGFRRFRGFCLPSAGGFKGEGIAWAMSLYAVEVLHRTSKSAEVGP